jgi:uracil-DNA glycosylase family 4
VTECRSCPNGGPQCKGQGPDTADLVIVGEAPGRDEVRQGTPFVGASGRLLNATLREVGLPRERVYVTNVVMCRPTDSSGKDSPPTKEMIRSCYSRLVAEIRSRSPKIVLCVGATAAQVLLNTSSPITEVKGSLNWNEDIGCFVLATYHPAAVLHGATGFFDDIFEHTRRAVQLASGLLSFPEPHFKLKWEYIDQLDRGLEVIRKVGYKPVLGYDTEAKTYLKTGPRPAMDEWIMMQIDDGEASYAWNMRELLHFEEFREALRWLFSRIGIKWILHNWSYEKQVFLANGMPIPQDVSDVMVLGLGLTERGEQVGLEALAGAYCNAPFYKDVLYSNRKYDAPPHQWHVGPQNATEWLRLADYGCHDAHYTRELGRILPKLVKQEGTLPLCRDLLLPAQDAFGDVEARGTLVDGDHVETLEREWRPLIDQARKDLQGFAKEEGFKASAVTSAQQKGAPCAECVPKEHWGHLEQFPRTDWREILRSKMGDPSCRNCMKRRFKLVPDETFNPNSAPQRQHLAFDILRMRRVEGNSVNKSFFEFHTAHPFTKLMKEYSERNHLMNNYVHGFWDDVWTDGRVHPDFLLFGTVTGRLSIHNPPLQTIPKWGVADPKMAKLVRKLIKATPGHVIVDVDYKNLELFVAWHYSKDENLGRALTEQDFHTATAAAIFNRPYEWFLDPANEAEAGLLRFNSKFVTFGIAYGRQAWSLSQGELKDITGGDERIAQEYIDRFWGLYPKYKEVYDGWQRDALTLGELTTPLGRKRRWRLVTRENRNSIKNQAVNFPIQSLASDTCLSALIRLNKRLRAEGLGYVLFTVHDSLVFEIREECLDRAVEVIIEEMTTPPYETHIKLFADVEVGPNLGEVHKYQAPLAA